MRKYLYVFLTGLQGSLVYRWNIAIRAAFSLVHLVFVFALWHAAYEGSGGLIGGFSIAQTLTYFIVIFFCNFAIGAWSEDYQIAEEIRNGTINQFLLKPVDYFAYRLALFAAARVVTALLALLPLLIASPLLGGYVDLPAEGWRWAAAIPALLGAALLQFCIAYLFGLLTFWFLDIQGFVILSMAAETLLSGQMFPLDLAPPAAQAVLKLLPYAYMMYFPVAVITGRVGPAETVSGLAIQAFWVVALLGLCTLVWQRGLARHTAVGG